MRASPDFVETLRGRRSGQVEHLVGTHPASEIEA